jgi:hypothetical protein
MTPRMITSLDKWVDALRLGFVPSIARCAEVNAVFYQSGAQAAIIESLWDTAIPRFQAMVSGLALVLHLWCPVP